MALASLIVVSAPAQSQDAGEFVGYDCTMRSAFELKDGALSPASMAGSPVGPSFFVERSTGQMIGYSFESADWETKFIEPGSNAQSFKVLFATPPHASLRLLVVNEYQEGRMKEFVLMENSTVYAGQCEPETIKWRRRK